MRVPPSLTNSATTPSSRRFTSSMKAGGKDHSRPTIRPTFKVIRFLPYLSIVTTDIHAYHLFPPWPVMGPAIPDAQGMPDILAPQDAGEVFVIRTEGFITASGEDDVHVAHCRQPGRVMLIPHEIAGIVEIDIVVRVAISKTADVVEATQSDDSADQVRMAKGKIDGMISAEARAGSDKEGIGVKPGGERQNFVKEIVVVLCLSPCPLCRMAPPGVPAFGIKAIDTKHLYPTSLQMLSERGHHASILPLEEPAL